MSKGGPRGSARRPPWALLLPAVLVAGATLAPVVYLVYRAVSPSPGETTEGWFTPGHVRLVWNTLSLALSVLAVSTVLAAPSAWLVTSTSLPLRRTLTLMLVMPLAVPGYVIAYAWLGQGGYGGMLTQWLGREADPVRVPRGFVGSLIALSLYNFPYLFLNLRAAFLELDPSLTQAAQSLGDGRWRVLRRVVLPQLTPAYLAGAALVLLHCIADFGVVSLMRYDTLTYRLYLNISYQDRAGLARVALLLLGLSSTVLAMEMLLVRGLRLDRAGTVRRPARRTALGPWTAAALALPLGVFIAGVLMPALVVAHWIRGLSWAEAAGHFAEEAGWSLKFSGAGAALATALALPVALLRARHPSAWSFALERVPYFGLAMPPLALALSLVFLFRGHGSYAEDGFRFALLSGALALHFMAESVGPLRSALYSRSPRLEEASRGLGASRAATFVRVTLPLLRHAMGVSLALVFLSCMKELPLTMLLAPEGARTLAVRLWSETHEAAFAEAAPRALAVLGISASFVGLLLLRERGAGSRPRRAVSGEGPILQGA